MAWDGIHLNVEWKNHVHMDVKPKYKQSCTYTLAGTYNKAKNFQRILWTRQSAEWKNLYPGPVLSPFWEAHDLDRKGQALVQGSC